MEKGLSDSSNSKFDLTGYKEQWTCNDGRAVILRPIRSDDRPIEKELINGLSGESSRFRFFYMVKEATEDMLHLFCDVDNNDAIAIIAEYDAGFPERNVGVVRLLVDPDQQGGEFAIVVADDFQGSGLGWKFMETLINIARARGLKSVYGFVLPDNYRMLKLLKEFDFTIQDEIDGEIKAVRELT